ncbi:hypothetical protein G3480_12970 [Thiorhodococcus mannitoliphagus]|uniref:DUF2357 domain-containing protein n=1 Tax=Thiorhodococcus mannitoliphagus TaxID=329406 RepID=A0A6P1E0C1_9GAMM|nr:hypothetical protein [Thiorhodococcus mannitoliphagus]NEX21215.1 hypothetical protein [Thiorhodococcus mannitoliphagus]
MTALRLRDRLDDRQRQVNDDAPLLEGRWVLEQPARQNGHTELAGGDLLVDDGAPRLRLGTVDSGFRRPRLPDDDRSDYQLALDAIAAITNRTDLTTGRWPSPLLPAELGQQSEPTQLDTLLNEVFERGHLDFIAIRPRLSMRYDTELLPVDRARRLDTGFQRHLAAHSECWAARTLSGVVPKIVLGRVSDDDADIYEHRVYARLLDHLERYLRGRIGKLSGIAARYQEGLKFNNSEAVDWPLRRDICEIWGEAVSTGEANRLLDQNREQLTHLERCLKHVQALKGRRIKGSNNGSLYQAIPRNSQVGLSLMPTNLLQHDAHYRQLRRLWTAWLAATAAERESPVQVLARRRADEERYQRYIGLLLLRVLHVMGFPVTWLSEASARANCKRWHDEVSLESRHHTWRISMNQHQLVLVPSAVPVDADTAAEWTTRTFGNGREIRVPCLLYVPKHIDSASPPECLVEANPAMQLSPLDLYAQEKVHALIAAWLWQRRLAGYGEIFQRLPQAVADAWPDTGQQHSLRKPLNDSQWSRLCEALDQHANKELRRRIEFRKLQVDRLAHCPECSSIDTRFDSNTSGFFAQCRSCGCRWELRDQQFRLKSTEREIQGFKNYGHRLLHFRINI